MRLLSLTPTDLDRRLPELAAILHACVRDGASVGFVLPFEIDQAAAFFRDKVRPGLAAGGRVLLAAELDDKRGGKLAGTVQLIHDTPPNQPHRAEVAKLLVHPAARRRGLARALMTRLEAEARARGRSLLTLDTRTGDTAEPLYAGLGFQAAGVIPGYCRDTLSDRMDPTTIMWKAL
jgi:ribosomal protein S18 acetylase RimI-like enzyme